MMRNLRGVRMHKRITSCCLVIFAVSSAVAASSNTAVVFRHVNVVNATGNPLQPDMAVVIEGQRITAIGKDASAQIPKDARIIEARENISFLGFGTCTFTKFLVIGYPGMKRLSRYSF
jgi:hypothetical protein